jgi:hypothetical protein
MTTLSAFLQTTAVAAAASGLLYTATVAVLALTAVLSHDPRRRAAARKTLQILLNRTPGPADDQHG